MEGIYVKGELIPLSTKNTIKHHSGWDDDQFIQEVRYFEKAAMGIIEATIDLNSLKSTGNGDYVISSLCKNYVLAKLYEHIAHTDYIDLANDMMVDFRETLRRIRDSQKEEGKISTKKKKGILIFGGCSK